jgi:hypothetical protein
LRVAIESPSHNSQTISYQNLFRPLHKEITPNLLLSPPPRQPQAFCFRSEMGPSGASLKREGEWQRNGLSGRRSVNLESREGMALMKPPESKYDISDQRNEKAWVGCPWPYEPHGHITFMSFD